MRVAITGASSHLGSNLARALLERGADVRAVTIEPLFDRVRALDWLNVERVHADVRDAEGINLALTGAELVYHLVPHVQGTANVMASCLTNDVRMVHLSTPGVSWLTMIDRGINYGLDAVLVDPSAMLGPWDFKPSRPGRFLIDMWEGRLPQLDVEQLDCIDVRDAADAFIGIGAKGETGRRYRLTATDRVRPFAETLADTQRWFSDHGMLKATRQLAAVG